MRLLTFICCAVATLMSGLTPICVKSADAQTSPGGGRGVGALLEDGQKMLFRGKSLGGGSSSAGPRDPLLLSPDSVMFDTNIETNNLNFRDLQLLRSLMITRQTTRFGMDPDFYDSEQDDRLARRAFALQLTRSVHQMLKGSELRQIYQWAYSGVKGVQDTMRFGVKDTPRGIGLGGGTQRNAASGKDLIEFNIGTNLQTGISPEVRFGESFRLRHDMGNNANLFEFGWSF